MWKNSLLALLFSISLNAQPTEQSLQVLGNAYLLPENKMYADSLAEVFADSLWEFISIEDNYDASLKSIRNLSVQRPSDGNFVLYTWAVPRTDGNFSFHGFLWSKKWQGKKRLVLEDYGTQDAAYRWLKGGQWVGGICYDVITKKVKGRKVYTLLTFRPGRTYHTKYIDALELGKSSKQVHFGSRIFNIRSNGDERYGQRPYRIQFRYNSAITAAVRWDGKHAGIICDHLAPSQEGLKERWFAYGPDFSYDRVYWARRKWQIEVDYNLIQSIDVAPTNSRIPTKLDPRR